MREAAKARAAFIKGLPMSEMAAQRRAARQEARKALLAEVAASPGTGAPADAARRHFPTFANNCSGLVRAVANELGHAAGLDGNADAQIGHMRDHWQTLSREEAIERANRGDLVVAGLPANEHSTPRNHGHVAVVTTGELYHGTYPRVWSGSLGGNAGRSMGDRSVGQIWRVDDRDRVQYFTPPARETQP